MKKEDFPHECPDCGFHYRDEKTAKECEYWCREKKTCNSEVRKQAYEMQES